MTNTAPTRHAILVGIDAYPSRPLGGCVSDVSAARRFLESQPGPPIKVQSFTASFIPSDPSPQDLPNWPSYQNVTRALSNLTKAAQAGDAVYVHFSGHGTRCEEPETGDKEVVHHATGDQGLVLLDRVPGRERVLAGPRLAVALRAMVDKGLRVTLALDCCFSGAVYRHDGSGVRFVATEDLKLGSGPESDEEPELISDGGGGEGDQEANTRGEKRTASLRPNWFINPSGYVILTACGPLELARERPMDDDNGIRHGVFSHHLLNLLKASHLGVRHREVYGQLRAKFDELGSPQHPEFYGNQDQPFFGSGGVTTRELGGEGGVSVAVVRGDGLLRLQVGTAHGVSEGDEFELVPWGEAERDEQQQQQPRERVLAYIKEVRGLSSDLALLNATAGLETGWNARPRTCEMLRKWPVALASDLPRAAEWPAALKARSLAACAESRRASAAFYVRRAADGEHVEIVDRSDTPVINIPSLPISDITAAADVLEHLSRYNLVRNLTNTSSSPPSSSSSFTSTFSISMTTTLDGQSHPPKTLIPLLDSPAQKFHCTLRVTNTGPSDIYVSLYNLGSSWEVDNISRGSGELVLPEARDPKKRGRFSRNLKMVVPEDMKRRGFTCCDDVIKVFVTSRPTSFAVLELGEMEGSRGKGKGKGMGLRSGSRVGEEEEETEGSEEWAAFEFPIRTSLRT